jgi:hypothetical protein
VPAPIPAAFARLDKKCGRSGIPDNRKCSKTTVNSPPPEGGGLALRPQLKAAILAAGLTAAAFYAARARYRSGVSASAADAIRRSREVDTTLKTRQKRIVFCVPGVSGSESIQSGQGSRAAWQNSLSPESSKKDEKTIQIDTRKANITPRDSSGANAMEIIGLHLNNQLRGRNEAAVDLAAQIIAHRKAHPDKQIVISGHSYGGAIAEEALAIVSRTKTPTKNIININFGTNNYGLLDGMINKDIEQVTFGGSGDPFTNGPTKNLRTITTVRGHSLRDYSSNSQVQAAVRNLIEDRAPLMKRDSLRADKKCGGSGIADNKRCHVGGSTGGSWPRTATIAAALTAGGLAAYAMSRRGSGSNQAAPGGAPPEGGGFKPPGPPMLPRPLTPKGLLPQGAPRMSKTQRMRENTAAAVRNAEGAIAQTAREEVRRVGQIGNTMATAGEAAGMATKTTLRELRLRTEAARRRFEPGYRAPDRGKASAQLPQGGGLPVTTSRAPSKAPDTLEGWATLASDPEGFRSAMRDPATGQPRRRRAQGFGRTDNFIQHYAPVLLQPPTRRDAEDGKKYAKTVTNPETGRKNTVRYGAKGYKIAPGTDKGDRYCARSFGDMKSEGYDCSGAERNTPLCLSRAKWRCSGKLSRRDGALTPGK